MLKKLNVIFCITLICTFLIDGCAQTPLAIHKKLDPKLLSQIKATDVFLITKQSGLVAYFHPDETDANEAVQTATPYAAPTTGGLIGLIIGSLIVHHISHEHAEKKIDSSLKEVQASMKGYSVEKSFSQKLTTDLHELKWLNSTNTNVVNAASDKHILNSILDESNSSLVMTIDFSYSLNQNLSSYWLNAVVTIYPKSVSLQSSAHHVSQQNYNNNENQNKHPILYKNYFHYALTLNGVRTSKAAANIWSNLTGPDSITNVTDNGLDTLARLITYDLSLYPYNLKDRNMNKHVSAFDGSGTINGTLVAENKYMVSIRTKSGAIYCLPRSK